MCISLLKVSFIGQVSRSGKNMKKADLSKLLYSISNETVWLQMLK